jgi:hypothetical protein
MTQRAQDAALLRLVDEYLAADKKWREISRAEAAVPRRLQFALERKSEAALQVVDRLLDRIERTRACTLPGIIAKAKVAICEGSDQEDFAAGMGLSISRDLLRLGTAANPKKRKAPDRQGARHG